MTEIICKDYKKILECPSSSIETYTYTSSDEKWGCKNARGETIKANTNINLNILKLETNLGFLATKYMISI